MDNHISIYGGDVNIYSNISMNIQITMNIIWIHCWQSIVNAMVFSVVMYGCESWTIKAESQRIDAFDLWCWRRLLRVPLDCKETKSVNHKRNQPWIFIGGTNAEAETPILLATWCKELIHWKRPWCWQRLRAGGEEGDRGWDDWVASLTRWTWIWTSSGRQWRTGKPGVHGVAKSQTQLSDWTTTNIIHPVNRL